MSPARPVARRTVVPLALLACTLMAMAMAMALAGPAAAATTYSLAVSTRPDRSGAVPLAGKVFVKPASIYVLATPSTGAERVRFYLDDTTMSLAARLIDSSAPFDFAGTASNGSATALDVGTLSTGAHTITAVVETKTGAPGVLSASFTVTAPAPPPPAPTSVDPSGVPAPYGNMPGWRQIFIDDFSQDVPLGSFPAAVSDKWSAYPSPWPDTSHNGRYDPERVVSIGGGMMDMFIHSEYVDGAMRHLVAAPEPRLPSQIAGLPQTYGRYAVRFRADALPGYKTAWLLWPTSETWPRDGEIDFPEGDLTGTICGFMHRMNGTSGGDQDGACSSATYPTWHTAIIEWTPSVNRFILDGNVLMESTERIPSTPMRWVLQTETALDGSVPANSTNGHVQVDWVAAYAPA